MPRTRRRSIPKAPVPPREYEKAYLHHLVRSGETLGAMLLSYANVQFYQELMARAREAIAGGALGRLHRGASPPLRQELR